MKRRAEKRILFLQCTEPAAYPPLINASWLMAEAGWNVRFLSAPKEGNKLALPQHERIEVSAIPTRPSFVMRKVDYLAYLNKSATLALAWKPDAVYASDPIAAMPGLLASRISRARLIYHEHDSPAPENLKPWIAKARRNVANRAGLVIFPNAERLNQFQTEVALPDHRTRVIWNMPGLSELPFFAPQETTAKTMKLYFHGSITPERLPETFVSALHSFSGRVQLTIAGYEAPGAGGYVKRLVSLGSRQKDGPSLVTFLGEIPQRGELLNVCARHDVGLAIMPLSSADLNMSHMTGASNKPFDYLAARLALIVSDLPDWRALFVDPGYGLACIPSDADSVRETVGWFLDHPDQRIKMGELGRSRIETDWNYDVAFQPILDALAT
jgi:glycosyltransferase involved in cell wall biosynthesis